MASRLTRFRQHKDEFFKRDDDSPLDADQKKRFRKLAYFAENPALDLVAPLDRATAGTPLMTLTTRNEERHYVRLGTIDVPLTEGVVRLTVLRDRDRGHIFIPFRDGSCGVESYQMGRYLEPQERPDGQLHVDFNYAYNPYCAYGDGWNCPIPPEENVTPLRIEAGEQAFVLP
jgi:uncharacterized protein (DUF1684 family)